MKYLGHLELVTLFSRAIRRADIPVAYSAGFHPLPKIWFGQPLAVGIESIAENLDMELTEYGKPEEIKKRLNATLPDGIKVLEAVELPLKLQPISAIITDATYLICLENSRFLLPLRREGLEELLNNFLKRGEVVIFKEREGKKKGINIRPLIKGLSLKGDNTIQLTLNRGTTGSVKPWEVIACLLEMPDSDSRLIPILKIKETHDVAYELFRLEKSI